MMKTPKSSDKKLVQARLPFKVLTTTLADDVPKENLLKKRKLSDKDYDSNAQKTEETEEEAEKEEVQHKKIKLLPEQCITVVLSDEEHNDEKLQTAIIKLPFANKKNKRKTKSVVKAAEVPDKIEIDEKRTKVVTEEVKDNDEKQQNLLDVSSDCNVCYSSSSEDKDTTMNMLTSDAQKTADNNESTSENKVKKPLTKKQLDLMERRRQAREDKERKLSEEKMQKQKEKEEREEAKKREREEKEEQKRKEREDREEKKRQEREEKELKRLAEIEAKNEEKRKRTVAREEERKRKDLEKEEAELKAKKRAEAFTKFFVPKTETNELQEKVEKEQYDQLTPPQEIKQNLAFRPFQVKEAMKLAPICRRQLNKNERQTFEQIMQKKDEEKENLYLKELKMGKHIPINCVKDLKETNHEIVDDDDDDVCIVGKLENQKV